MAAETKPPVAQSSTFGVTSLVTGIVGFVLAWVPLLGFASSVIAVVFGILGIRKNSGKGMAIAGLVVGGITLVIGFFVALFWFIALAAASATDPTILNSY